MVYGSCWFTYNPCLTALFTHSIHNIFPYITHFSTLTMEAADFLKTVVSVYSKTICCISEHCSLNIFTIGRTLHRTKLIILLCPLNGMKHTVWHWTETTFRRPAVFCHGGLLGFFIVPMIYSLLLIYYVENHCDKYWELLTMTWLPATDFSYPVHFIFIQHSFMVGTWLICVI
jgi:hypothetical protein